MNKEFFFIFEFVEDEYMNLRLNMFFQWVIREDLATFSIDENI